MQKYAVQRILLSLPTIVLISLLVFIGMRVAMPASVIDVMLGEYAGDAELRDTLEEELGLKGNVFAQYLEWTGISWLYGGETGILQGDFGRSLHSGRPIIEEVKHRIPVSFELGLWGQAMGIMFAIPMGVWAALKQDKWPDYGLRGFAILLNAVPGFWLAILIITFGSIWFNWAPPIEFKSITEDPIDHFKTMIFPALLVGLTPSGFLIRLTRTQMLEVLRQDYVRTARAKGLGETAVLYRHALRNALVPIVTVIGVNLASIVAGTVIYEQIFLIPGMGRYLVDSINALDYPVIQGLTLIFAVLLSITVMIVDLSYAWLDPRIRLR